MLSPLVPHCTFQEPLRTELLRSYPDPAKDLRPWAEALQAVWFADLDFAEPLLTAPYSDVGRPNLYSPKDLLRCLLLCQQRACRRA